MLTREQIAESIKNAAGRGLQEPKRGIVSSLNSDSANAYTCLVKVLGQEEEIEATYNPYFGSQIQVNLPVRLLINDDNQMEIVGIDTGAAQDAFDGEFPNVEITGVIPVANGGTGADLSGSTTGDIPYVESDGNMDVLGIGTSGQVLTSDGTRPVWDDASDTLAGITPTNGAGLMGNGTNWFADPSPSFADAVRVNDSQGAAGIAFLVKSQNLSSIINVNGPSDWIGFNQAIVTNNTLMHITPQATRSALRIDSSNPSTKSNGQFWLSSTSNRFTVYQGGAEEQILAASPSTDNAFIQANTTRWEAVTAPVFPNVTPTAEEGMKWFSDGGDGGARFSQHQDGMTLYEPGTKFVFTGITSVSNTTTETAFNLSSGVGSITFPANAFTLARLVRITASGRSSSTGTPTLQMRLKLTDTTPTTRIIADTGTLTASGLSNSLWWYDAMMRVENKLGSNDGMWAQARLQLGTVFSTNANTASATISPSLAHDLSLEITWSVADPANIIRLDLLTIEVLY